MTTEALWLDRFTEAVGLPPIADEERNALLGLAAAAAHASERTSAPLSCWLAGRSGLSAAEALALAERLARELGGSTGPESGDPAAPD